MLGAEELMHFSLILVNRLNETKTVISFLFLKSSRFLSVFFVHHTPYIRAGNTFDHMYQML